MNAWIAFKGYNNNKAVNASDVDLNNLRPFGVHWYSTEAQAEANPNSVVGFPNPLAAVMIPMVNATIADANNARDFNSIPSNVAGAVPGGTAIENAVSGLSSIASRLTSANMWLRIGEFTLGVLLILAGTLTLSGHNGDVVSLAKKAIK